MATLALLPETAVRENVPSATNYDRVRGFLWFALLPVQFALSITSLLRALLPADAYRCVWSKCLSLYVCLAPRFLPHTSPPHTVHLGTHTELSFHRYARES